MKKLLICAITMMLSPLLAMEDKEKALVPAQPKERAAASAKDQSQSDARFQIMLTRDNKLDVKIDPRIVPALSGVMTQVMPRLPSLPTSESIMARLAESIVLVREAGMPFLQYYDLVEEMVEAIRIDSRSGYLNAIRMLNHFFLSNILVRPDHVEYMRAIILEIAQVLDAKAIGERMQAQAIAQEEPDAMAYIMLGATSLVRVLDTFCYEKDTSKLFLSTGIPQAGGEAARVVFRAVNTYARVQGAEKDVIPLKGTGHALRTISAEPPRSPEFISLQNALFRACRESNLDLVKDYLRRYPALIDDRSAIGDCPLFHALGQYVEHASDAAKQVLIYLVQRGADFDLPVLQKRGSLYDAVEEGARKNNNEKGQRYKAVQVIFDEQREFLKQWHAWVEAKKTGQDALKPNFNMSHEQFKEFLTAMILGDLRKVIKLIDAYPRLKYYVDDNGMTALHLAACYCLQSVIDSGKVSLGDKNSAVNVQPKAAVASSSSRAIVSVVVLEDTKEAAAQPAPAAASSSSSRDVVAVSKNEPFCVAYIRKIPGDHREQKEAMEQQLRDERDAKFQELALIQDEFLRDSEIEKYKRKLDERTRKFQEQERDRPGNYVTILSYLLNTGVPDVADNQGRTAEDYVIYVADCMAASLNIKVTEFKDPVLQNLQTMMLISKRASGLQKQRIKEASLNALAKQALPPSEPRLLEGPVPSSGNGQVVPAASSSASSSSAANQQASYCSIQ